MSSDCEEVFDAINSEVRALRARWNVFSALYDKDENVDLLNKSGSIVFFYLQRFFIDDAIIRISRLTDPTSLGKNKNASIKSLLDNLNTNSSTRRFCKFTTRVSEINDEVINIRTHRNKAIAHFDKDYAIKKYELPSLKYADIESAIEKVCTLMTDLGREAFGKTAQYNMIFKFDSGPYVLLNKLRIAADIARDKDEKLK